MQKDSQEFSDACELWELYEEVKAELLEETFGELEDHFVPDQPGAGNPNKGDSTPSSDSDATDIEDYQSEEKSIPENGGELGEGEMEEVGVSVV